jgi:tetratricopeptide (TPR) repeat protein
LEQSEVTFRGNSCSGLQWKSYYHYLIGEYDQALDTAREMSELAVSSGSKLWRVEADRITGWIHFQRDDLNLSRKYFEGCIAAVKSEPEEHVSIRTSYSLGVAEETEKLIAADTLSLAMIDLREQRPDTAMERIEWAGTRLEGHSRLMRAEALLATGSVDEAISVAEKPADWKIPYMSDRDGMLVYNHPSLKDVLARAYLAKGNLHRAIAEYEKLAALDPKSKVRSLIHPRAHFRLAELYVEGGQRAKAVPEYQAYLETWKGKDGSLEKAQKAIRDLSG